VGHALRSSGLLHLEASLVRVSQFGLRNGGGAMRMVHVASSLRLRRVEAEDGWVDAMGCIGPLYPNFAVFVVLDHRGILVFCLGL
jgi:hypothetical protein